MPTQNWGDISLPYTIVSIDLGETTGIAAFEFLSRDLRHTATEHFHALFPLLALLNPDEILLERFPSAHSLEYALEIVYRQLSAEAILISPSEWKPFMKSKKRKFPDVKTKHEKDAINMLRYYLLTSFNRDIP